ncbi:adenylate kinase [Dactylosporangium sp. NPDC049140]|uniref:adenylate kinase n=1 Tax=Dactylosporangium sp. NPDC049140 TaxID=3155647 RepID=UPI0033C4C704
MRVVMIAPPGAGKGTQGALLAAHLGVPRIVTGELFRDHVARQTALGRAVRDHMDHGRLVPDHIVLDMVGDALTSARATGGGYVLDGVPRTMTQARAVHTIARRLDMTTDVALHLDIGDDEARRRLLARAAAERRRDDTPDVIDRRLRLYHRATAPVLGWYRRFGNLVSVDGARSADRVWAAVQAAIGVPNQNPDTVAIAADVL